MNTLRTLKDASVEGKQVLLRLDLNVPINDKGEITDDTRLVKSLPTLKYLIDHGAKVIILTHLGRPKGKVVEDLRVDILSEALSQLLGQKIQKLHECIGPEVMECVNDLDAGEVCMLENTRFYHGEEINDEGFARELSQLGDIYVSDAFGAVHRAHASTVGIAQFIPAYAGLLLEKEVKVLSGLLSNPDKPLILIVGGAKIDTKIGVLSSFLPIADSILIGGALANTFLCSEGYEIGDSLCEHEKLGVAQSFLLEAEKKQESIILPIDLVVADEISEDANTLNVKIDAVSAGMKILDMGPQTRERFIELINESKTIIWNGPLGLYEMSPFENGTKDIVKALAECSATTIIGGGDTIDAIKKFGYEFDQFTHISTGGGAMLEFLQGKSLPGISILEEK